MPNPGVCLQVGEVLGHQLSPAGMEFLVELHGMDAMCPFLPASELKGIKSMGQSSSVTFADWWAPDDIEPIEAHDPYEFIPSSPPAQSARPQWSSCTLPSSPASEALIAAAPATAPATGWASAEMGTQTCSPGPGGSPSRADTCAAASAVQATPQRSSQRCASASSRGIQSSQGGLIDDVSAGAAAHQPCSIDRTRAPASLDRMPAPAAVHDAESRAMRHCGTSTAGGACSDETRQAAGLPAKVESRAWQSTPYTHADRSKQAMPVGSRENPCDNDSDDADLLMDLSWVNGKVRAPC